MIRTRVGYAGGTKKNPTYRSLGDHTETLQIDYDPSRISYEDLLKVFWESHSPTTRHLVRQYKAAVFYHNDTQRKLAVKSRDQVAARLSKDVHTEVLPFSGFTLAEPYHQKYRLQLRGDFMEEFRSMYPDAEGIVNSTAAARVNGYLAGYGTLRQLEGELGRLGLSPASREKLLEEVGRPGRLGCPLNQAEFGLPVSLPPQKKC